MLILAIIHQNIVTIFSNYVSSAANNFYSKAVCPPVLDSDLFCWFWTGGEFWVWEWCFL